MTRDCNVHMCIGLIIAAVDRKRTTHRAIKLTFDANAKHFELHVSVGDLLFTNWFACRPGLQMTICQCPVWVETVQTCASEDYSLILALSHVLRNS